MTNYEVVEMIMNSNIPDNYKLYLIQSFFITLYDTRRN